MTVILREPRIDERPEQPYLGIRVITPFKGMGKVADTLRVDLADWFKRQGISPAGVPFLRYHVIDMAGDMDIEAGLPVAVALPGDGKVMPGVIPAGSYASLVYSGSGFTGNKTLIEWARANGIAWDRWDDLKGDGFRCRYEQYLTDIRAEPRKTKWEIEVAIKVVRGS